MSDSLRPNSKAAVPRAVQYVSNEHCCEKDFSAGSSHAAPAWVDYHAFNLVTDGSK